MPFDPTKPLPNSLITSAELRDQFNGLKTEIDQHAADTANPHAVTKAQVGLGNVPDVDATNAGNLSSGLLPPARIADGTLPLSKLQNVTDNRVLGRSVGAAGSPQEINVGSGLTLAGGTLAATPAGVSGHVQYNQGGAFASSTQLQFGVATSALTVGSIQLIGATSVINDSEPLKVMEVEGRRLFAADGSTVVLNFSARQAAVPDATGGTTIDTQARAAINSLLARLRACGLLAP